MTLLVTGGAGFIGSNFITHLLSTSTDLKIVNLDKLTYAGNLENLEDVVDDPNYIFEKGDICDKSLVEELFKKYNPNAVVHFAAESHVDNSIVSPDSFIKTNIEGTYNLLQTAKKYWGEHNKSCRFHHISTDEVYGSLGETGLFDEKTTYAPNSPYSASKAASDFLVRSYHQTYGLNTVTSNCSNNFGPKQHNEKLVPTIIRTAIEGKQIPIYGNGKNIRDWLYVDDHCRGIDTVFKTGRTGETYLLGGNNERTNLEIASKICAILDAEKPKSKGSYKEQIAFVEDRKGHDFRYAIDATKAKRELNWKVEESFDSGLQKTVKWYLHKYQKEDL